eukprot:491565_1
MCFINSTFAKIVMSLAARWKVTLEGPSLGVPLGRVEFDAAKPETIIDILTKGSSSQILSAAGLNHFTILIKNDLPRHYFVVAPKFAPGEPFIAQIVPPEAKGGQLRLGNHIPLPVFIGFLNYVIENRVRAGDKVHIGNTVIENVAPDPPITAGQEEDNTGIIGQPDHANEIILKGKEELTNEGEEQDVTSGQLLIHSLHSSSGRGEYYNMAMDESYSDGVYDNGFRTDHVMYSMYGQNDDYGYLNGVFRIKTIMWAMAVVSAFCGGVLCTVCCFGVVYTAQQAQLQNKMRMMLRSFKL